MDFYLERRMTGDFMDETIKFRGEVLMSDLVRLRLDPLVCGSGTATIKAVLGNVRT